MKYEEKIIQRLIQRQKTLTTAESCTGGLLSARLTDIPGASEVFKLGLITYSNDAKISLLNIPAKLMQRQGAVSEDIARLMAQNARQIHNTDFGVGITGIAGPSGGTRAKPAGTVFIAIATTWETRCVKCQFEGTRAQIRLAAVKQAMKSLLELLG
jgi:PncC family amidohydrolase